MARLIYCAKCSRVVGRGKPFNTSAMIGQAVIVCRDCYTMDMSYASSLERIRDGVRDGDVSLKDCLDFALELAEYVKTQLPVPPPGEIP